MVRLSGALLHARAARIRLVVSDVDGVLTDAGVYYSARGEELKRFNVRDGMGVELLRAAGIETALLTREQSEVVVARARKLDIGRVYMGERDKREALPRLIHDAGVAAEQVAYIGDDLNDLDALRWLSEAGLSACPADAMLPLVSMAHYVTAARGGHGAFRELCDLILYNRKEHTP